MKRKSILALALCGALTVATFVGLSATANAEGLTQSLDSSKVSYGTVSASDQAMLQEFFEYDYYKRTNPDVVAAVGDDYNALFAHFVNYGIWEGRSADAEFNVNVYASAYDDLSSAYGSDVLAYYRHYATTGKNESRPVTTFDYAIAYGVTVQSLTDSEIVLTPALMSVAKSTGATSVAAASYASEKIYYQAEEEKKAEAAAAASAVSAASNPVFSSCTLSNACCLCFYTA